MVLGWLLLAAGCSFDSSGTGPLVDARLEPVGDGAVPDGATDQGPDRPADGGGPEQAVPDTTPPLDIASPPDATVDLPPPDSAPPADSTVDLPPSCGVLFGAVSGYTPCEETASSCRFYSNMNGKSCSQICGGQACIAAEDNAPSDKCAPESPMSCGDGPCTCASPLSNGICTCGR